MAFSIEICLIKTKVRFINTEFFQCAFNSHGSSFHPIKQVFADRQGYFFL